LFLRTLILFYEMLGAFKSWAFGQSNRSPMTSSQIETEQRGRTRSDQMVYLQPALVPKHSSTLNQSYEIEVRLAVY